MTFLWIVALLGLWPTRGPAQMGFQESAVRLGKGAVYQLFFSPDSQTLVVVSGLGVGLYEASSLGQVALLEGVAVQHAEGLHATLSADGRRLATINRDTTISLWSIAEARLLATLQGHTDRVTALAFSPQGDMLASGADDGAIIAWEAAHGVPLGSMQAEAVRVLAFSPDGQVLASGNGFRAVRVWELEHFQQVALFRHDDHVTRLAFSADGGILASGSKDLSVRLWDMNHLAVEELARFRGEGEIRELCFSPDGKQVVFQDLPTISGASVYLGDVASGKQTTVVDQEDGDDLFLGFALDGKGVVSLNNVRRKVYTWSPPDPVPVDSLAVEEIESGFPPRVLSPDGKLLVARTGDDQLGVWSLPLHRRQGALRGYNGPVTAVAFSPDGQWVAGAMAGAFYGTNKVRLWDAHDYRLLGTLQSDEPIVGIVCARDGRQLLIASSSGVWSWDLQTLRDVEFSRSRSLPDGVTSLVEDVNLLPLVQRFLARTGRTSVRLSAFALSPNGGTLALGMETRYLPSYPPVGMVVLWDVAAGSAVGLLEGPTDGVLGVAFHPRGQQLAAVAASNDSLVRLWNLESGQQIRTLPAPVPGGYTLAFSPGGQRLALGTAVAFSPDNHLLATGGGRTRLWELNTDRPPAFIDAGFSSTTLWDVTQEQKVAELDGFKEYTGAVAFSPDGTLLAEGKGSVLVLRHTVGATTVELAYPVDPSVPAPPALWPNLPNPCNGQTLIGYALSQPGGVKLGIFNLAGQQVIHLVDQEQAAGQYQVTWDGQDEQGRGVGSGVYLYRLEAGPFRQTRRLVLVK